MKVAVIVGAGSKHDKGGSYAHSPPDIRWGLGGALCLRFAAEGFHVVMMGRRCQTLDAIAAEIKGRGGSCTAVTVDVADASSVQSAFGKVKSIGDVDVLVFNVGPLSVAGAPFKEGGHSFTEFPNPHEIDVDYMNAAFNNSVTGCVRCVREVIPRMLQRARGTILMSGAALQVNAHHGSVSPMKYALRALSQSMFKAYASQGIHVANVVIDGVIQSPNMIGWKDSHFLLENSELAGVYFKLYEEKAPDWSEEVVVSWRSKKDIHAKTDEHSAERSKL